MRIVVEHSIGRIKNYKIIGGIFKHFSFLKENQFDPDKIFYICCCLVNEALEKKPLRKDDWCPQSKKIFYENFLNFKKMFFLFFFLIY